MIPPKTVVIAAGRWLNVLRDSTVEQAASILASSPRYSDLSSLNYQEAFAWLESLDLTAVPTSGRDPIRVVVDDLISSSTDVIDRLEPDDLPDVGYLPAPLAEASSWLGVPPEEVWSRARARIGKIDTQRRERIGQMGELALAQYLASEGCSIYHGSLESDGLGWDIEAKHSGSLVHIEVKTTTSFARAKMFLSRNEFEVSIADPSWVLALVQVDDSGELLRFATTTSEILRERVPTDNHSAARWEACSLSLAPSDLTIGFPVDRFLPVSAAPGNTRQIPLWWPT